MALLAGFIARFSMFRHLLMIEQRGPREKIQFAAFLGLPFMVGVLARLLAGYPTTDLSLEVTVLAGLLGGTIVGLAVALIVNLPILLIALWVAALSLFPAFAHSAPAWLIPYYRPELLALCPWPRFMRWRRARRAGSVPTRKKSGNSRLPLI